MCKGRSAAAQEGLGRGRGRTGEDEGGGHAGQPAEVTALVGDGGRNARHECVRRAEGEPHSVLALLTHHMRDPLQTPPPPSFKRGA